MKSDIYVSQPTGINPEEEEKKKIMTASMGTAASIIAKSDPSLKNETTDFQIKLQDLNRSVSKVSRNTLMDINKSVNGIGEISKESLQKINDQITAALASSFAHTKNAQESLSVDFLPDQDSKVF